MCLKSSFISTLLFLPLIIWLKSQYSVEWRVQISAVCILFIREARMLKFKIIEEVKKRPNLWINKQITDEDFTLSPQAFKEIGKAVGDEAKIVESHWSTLCNGYRRYVEGKRKRSKFDDHMSFFDRPPVKTPSTPSPKSTKSIMTSPEPDIKLAVIEAVKCRPELWSPNHADHECPSTLDAAWFRVSKEAHQPALLCKTVWTSLSASFRKHIETRSKFQYSDEMQFLRPTVEDAKKVKTSPKISFSETLGDSSRKKRKLDTEEVKIEDALADWDEDMQPKRRKVEVHNFCKFLESKVETLSTRNTEILMEKLMAVTLCFIGRNRE